MTAIDDVQQSDQVRALRALGLAPKQIARALGLRPADVLDVLNQPVTAGEPASVARCWVSAGWANEVRVNGHDDWPGRGHDVESPGGLVCVLVARRHRHDKVSVCGYLVDVHCLGVKNTLGPDVMDEVDLVAFRRHFFGAYGDHLPAPLELAQQLVLGAVDYARGLGFDPHPDYADSAAHLAGPLSRCDIEFGRDGMPFFVEGPYDDASEIMRTLDASVGPDNYHFLRTVPMSALAG